MSGAVRALPGQARREGTVAHRYARQEEKVAVGRYERFLRMPVWFVLAVMWVGVAAVMGSSVLTLYLVGSLLPRTLS